jgi:hypothetical protein
MELQGKRIVLGVTGGIAAYKAAELVRLLGKQGADVQVAMTEGATHFVTPPPFRRSPASRFLPTSGMRACRMRWRISTFRAKPT